MQNKRLSNKDLFAGMLPVMLSALVAVGVLGTTTMGVALAKSPAPVTQKQPAKSKNEAPKSDSSTKADGSKKDKPKAATPQEIDASIASATTVGALDLMKAPDQYVNKKVTFTGTFNRFADIALDYKKAFRDSRDYVTFFILRPDVTAHTIPLAEMKLFFPRKKSDEVMDLESGDKIQVVGTAFSSALDEPWIDVEHVKILEKTTKPEKKHTPEF